MPKPHRYHAVVFHNLRGYDSHLLMQAISEVRMGRSHAFSTTESSVSPPLSGSFALLIEHSFCYVPGQSGSGQQTRSFPDYSPVRASRRGMKTAHAERYLPLRVHSLMGALLKVQTTPQRGFPQQAFGHAHQQWGLHSSAKGLEVLWQYNPWGLSLPLQPHWRHTAGRCLWDISEDLPETVRSTPCSLLYEPRAFVECLAQEDRSWARAANRHDQHLFIKKGIRGGISVVSKCYTRANNPRVEGYDQQKSNSHILYLDANNLYGWVMSRPLPTGGFRWVEDCDPLAKTITEHPADSPQGYIAEADLEYPEELHRVHNTYPLAPEKMDVGSSTQPAGYWGGYHQGWEPSALPIAGHALEEDSPVPLLWAESLHGALHKDEHWAP